MNWFNLMNPWELFIQLLGWFFVVLMVLGGIIILIGVLVSVWRGVRSWFKPKQPR